MIDEPLLGFADSYDQSLEKPIAIDPAIAPKDVEAHGVTRSRAGF